jgi:branched-chain amino acid transport system permease protein
VLLVIFVPHGIVGTYMGWRARREAEAISRAASCALPAKARPEAGHA